MLNRFIQRIKPYHKYAIGAAWFFVAYTLANLLWVVASKWGDPSGPTSLYQTTVDGETYRAIALTYTGVIGIIFAMLQGLLVTSAAAVTILPWRKITLKQRRIGHAVLCGWAGLWLLNLMRLTGIDNQFSSYGQTAMTALLFTCTAYRAACGWSGSKRIDAMPIDEQDVDALEETFKPDFIAQSEIANSSKIDEIDPPESLDSIEPPGPAKETSSPSLLKQWVSATKSLLGSTFKKAKKPAAFVGRKLKAAPNKAKIYLRSHGVLPRPNRSTAA